MKAFKMLQPRKTHRGLIFSSLSLALIFLIAIFALSFLSSSLSLHSPSLFSAKKHIFIITQTLHQTSQELTRELPILQSGVVSEKPQPFFDQRLQEFLNSNPPCDSQFFMTWLSPAPLFGNRETLAVETLFRSHPNACLIILSESLDSPAGNRILQPISGLGFRILPIAPDIPLLLKHTPALEWYKGVKTGEIEVGQIPFPQNLSNLLRLAVLYKYGGAYIDTDFVVLRSFSGLRNAICAQSMNAETGEWWRLNNAVLIFDRHHPLLLRFMEEFVKGFNGSKWGHNGPYLVSRVVQSVSNGGGGGGESEEYDFTVLPPVAFYPVDWTRISGLFKRPNTTAHNSWARVKLAQLKSGRTFGVHLWNKRSSGLRIEEGSVIGRLISDRCMICKGIFTS